MKFIAITDIHQNLSYLDKIKEKITGSDLLIIAGDITHFAGADEAKLTINKFKQFHNNIIAVAGNVDRIEVEQYLQDEGVSIHGRGRVINGVGFFGLGGSNYTPFSTPNEIDDFSIQTLLEQGYKQVTGANPIILVSHSPPYGTNVDVVRSGTHAGSSAVRKFIESHKVELCICGHIHEARGKDRVGNTIVINPPPFFTGGYIEGKIKKGQISSQINQLP